MTRTVPSDIQEHASTGKNASIILKVCDVCAYDHVTIVHDDGKNICDHKCNEDRVKLIENEIMKNKADHEKEFKTLKDEMNLHKIISANKSKDLENKITEVNNLYSRFNKLENLV